jgi:hypothetical protein
LADLLNEHRGEGDEALLDAMEAQVKALKDYLARTRKADDYWIECECPVRGVDRQSWHDVWVPPLRR